MKNSIFKKLVALSLAVLMLVGSGIGAAIAGIDLAGLVGIKASAEDPHNDIFYDEEKGLFFEVIGGRARILGAARDAVLASPCMEDGVYTLPNKVTNSLTDIEYYVFELADYALFNFRLDVTKLIIPDNFRALTIPEASFAGWDNLTEVQWDIHNATVLGPLFEWLCEWNFGASMDVPPVDPDNPDNPGDTPDEPTGDEPVTGVAKNVFPLRDEYGSPIFNDEGTEVLVRFYSTEYHNGFTTDYYDMYIPFDDALNHYSPQTLTNINTVSKKDLTLVSGYWFEIYKDGINFDDVSVGTYDLSFTHDYDPDYDPYPEDYDHNLYVEDYDWNYASYTNGTKLDVATVSMGCCIDPLRTERIGTATYTEQAVEPSHNSNPTHNYYFYNHENMHACYAGGFARTNAGKPSSIIDGNASWHENVTIALHKSPVKVLTLGSNVTKVPDYLCYDLEIETINLQNVKTIGDYAFVDCNALLSIDLSNVETINIGGFASCDGLTSIDFGKVKTIGEWGFAACDGFTDLTISEDITEIGGGAFSFCDELKKLNFESSACGIGKVVVPSDVDHGRTFPKPAYDFGCRPSVIVEYTPFTECKLLTTMIFGNKVRVIPSNIGYNVTTLKKIICLANDIPNAVGENAFKYCDSIDEIEVIDPEKWTLVQIGEGNDSLLFDDITIKKHQHVFETRVVAATCSSEGYTVEICFCGTENGRSNIQPKLPHTLPENRNAHIDATCEGEGYDLYICTVCGEGVKKNVQPALEHDYSDTKTYPATCLEAGKITGTCSRCHDEITLETIPALGHDFGEYKYNNDATDIKDGTETARCSRCGIVSTRTVPGTSYQGKLKNAVFNTGEEKTVEHRSKVVITSRAANVPDGFHLGIVVNNKLVAEGDNTSVQYTVNEITEDTTFYTYIYDASGKIATKNPHKTDVANVNTGFFAKIVSFFKGLFGMLPTVNFG